MADKPIIFSAPMVRALLDGRKTQTRRQLSREWSVCGASWRHSKWDYAWDAIRWGEAYEAADRLKAPWCHPDDEPTSSEECGIYSIFPPYEVGDCLWVREVHAVLPPFAPGQEPTVVPRADWRDDPCATRILPRDWRSPIHMPRWASRLTLTVTEVRVQRLQDISREDALAEGALEAVEVPYVGAMTCDQARDAFSLLWDSIHGPGAWGLNPWVCAISFTVEPRNIDAGAA